MCDTAGQNSVHHDLKPSRIEKDERSIQAIVNLLENNWANPSDNRNTELVHLSSGAVPSESICNDLTKTQEIGEHAFQMFVTEWLERNHPSRKFTNPIRKQKLNSFSSMTKTKRTATVSGRETVLRVNCNLFGTTVLASQSRDLNIKEVLSHPLGPIPWALATPEGLRRTTSKSTLANELIKLSTTPEEIPRPSATVIDGMAIVQKVNANKKTMRAISNTVLTIAVSEAEGSASTDIMFDVYKDMSNVHKKCIAAEEIK